MKRRKHARSGMHITYPLNLTHPLGRQRHLPDASKGLEPASERFFTIISSGTREISFVGRHVHVIQAYSNSTGTTEIISIETELPKGATTNRLRSFVRMRLLIRPRCGSKSHIGVPHILLSPMLLELEYCMHR